MILAPVWLGAGWSPSACALTKTLGVICHRSPVHCASPSSQTNNPTGRLRLSRPSLKWETVNWRRMAKPLCANQLTHSFGMEIEIQAHEFHRLQAERVPGLLAQEVADNGFEITLIGKFQDESGPRAQDLADLF